MADSPVILSLRGLRKSFDTLEAVAGLDLDVQKGEFLTLLGPSGCGKTTTLRIIAGLETPTAGRVLLDGKDVTCLAPERRAVNTVFQNYALFPHMSVAGNVGYGLRMRGEKKESISRRVEEMLELVQLPGYGRRMPSQLSGGQRQRVAIARALILSPRILLLDEPLGALDLQLRRQMQAELKRIQQALGITFIYITHDQEEALAMSDRVALMRHGRIVQMDTPRALYEQPKTAFAASFIGETNLIRSRAEAAREGEVLLSVAGFTLPCPSEDWVVPGEDLLLSLRAERVRVSIKPENAPCRVQGEIVHTRYAGGERTLTVCLPDGQEIRAREDAALDEPHSPGSAVWCYWEPEAGILVRDDLAEDA